MIKEIEKLKTEKEKLQTEKKQINTELGRINRAIKNFEKGINALNGTEIRSSRKPGLVDEIETILGDHKEMHLQSILIELRRRGFYNTQPSVSGLLQTYVKNEKKFVKTAPATYALLKENNEAKLEESPKLKEKEMTVLIGEIGEIGELGETEKMVEVNALAEEIEEEIEEKNKSKKQT